MPCPVVLSLKANPAVRAQFRRVLRLERAALGERGRTRVASNMLASMLIAYERQLRRRLGARFDELSAQIDAELGARACVKPVRRPRVKAGGRSD